MHVSVGRRFKAETESRLVGDGERMHGATVEGELVLALHGLLGGEDEEHAVDQDEVARAPLVEVVLDLEGTFLALRRDERREGAKAAMRRMRRMRRM